MRCIIDITEVSWGLYICKWGETGRTEWAMNNCFLYVVSVELIIVTRFQHGANIEHENFNDFESFSKNEIKKNNEIELANPI